MEYLRARCGSPALSLKSKSLDVSLTDFAKNGNLTEAQYSRKLFDKLESGQLLDLLNIESQVKIGDWISQKFLDNSKEFLIVFKLSMNRLRNVALFCVCSMNLKDDEPKIYVDFAIPGFMDATPPEAQNITDRMILNFDDMEPRI